jgi:hypothetical protein
VLRSTLCSLAVLGLCMALAVADDKDKAGRKDSKDKREKEAKITKVDAKKGTVTVKMKDKDGKEVEKTFRLAEDVRYLDSTGRVAAIGVFTSGDMVLIIEREGKIQQMKKKDKSGTGRKSTDKK